MKITSLLITLIFLFSVGIGVLAQETELPDPGLTPDSPFYFLETIVEEIGTFFTFGDLKKAERYAVLAAERLAEARALVDKDKPELAEKTLARYQTQLEKSMERAEKAQTRGKSTEEVMTRAGQATSKHLDVLAEVYEKVPDQTKPAIERAMEVSMRGHEKAVEALKAQNALGDVPEEVSLPAQIPSEVRERVQTRVQQQLQIEEALKSIDTSKSLRDICQEQGGTPEMCAEFPSEPFESFEQIEDYCTGLGGPSEICTSLEDRCREYGATTPNECFILLSAYSIKAYQATELKAVSVPTLPEGEMQQERIQVGPEGEPTRTEKRLKQRYTPGVSKVIIYSTPTCPHCVSAIQWFQENGIEYEVIDISQNETKQDELMERVGQLAVPIIEVEDDIMVGFNEEEFSELFGIE